MHVVCSCTRSFFSWDRVQEEQNTWFQDPSSPLCFVAIGDFMFKYSSSPSPHSFWTQPTRISNPVPSIGSHHLSKLFPRLLHQLVPVKPLSNIPVPFLCLCGFADSLAGRCLPHPPAQERALAGRPPAPTGPRGRVWRTPRLGRPRESARGKVVGPGLHQHSLGLGLGLSDGGGGGGNPGVIRPIVPPPGRRGRWRAQGGRGRFRAALPRA